MPLMIAIGKPKKGGASMPPPEMPKFSRAAKPPSRGPEPPKPPSQETETDERNAHDLTGEKFSAERLLFHDGSETCANCHHFDQEGGTCKIGDVEVTDPAVQGCYAGYEAAENEEQPAAAGQTEEEERAA